MNHKVGRVTPCAPPSLLTSPGAHGVTRPTTAARFRGSMSEIFRGILSLRERVTVRGNRTDGDAALQPVPGAVEPFLCSSRAKGFPNMTMKRPLHIWIVF